MEGQSLADCWRRRNENKVNASRDWPAIVRRSLGLPNVRAQAECKQAKTMGDIFNYRARRRERERERARAISAAWRPSLSLARSLDVRLLSAQRRRLYCSNFRPDMAARRRSLIRQSAGAAQTIAIISGASSSSWPGGDYEPAMRVAHAGALFARRINGSIALAIDQPPSSARVYGRRRATRARNSSAAQLRSARSPATRAKQSATKRAHSHLLRADKFDARLFLFRPRRRGHTSRAHSPTAQQPDRTTTMRPTSVCSLSVIDLRALGSWALRQPLSAVARGRRSLAGRPAGRSARNLQGPPCTSGADQYGQWQSTVGQAA